MMKRTASVLILILLIISTLASVFNLQTVKANPPLTPCWQTLATSLQSDWETETKKLGKEYYQNFDFDNDTFAEFVIGVDAPESQIQLLKDSILWSGGKVTETISTGKIVRALAVKVSTKEAGLFIQNLRTNKVVKYLEPNSKVEAAYVPDDPAWTQQWGPLKIEADYAWNTTIGSSDILVAIVDTGIDYTHPELAANYVPLGYDWVNQDSDPMDDHGHGTHCAGIVAAKINNSIGIAGLAQVRIMAEKVLTSSGWGFDTWIAEGIYHATDSGARIISMSLGGDEDTSVMHDAVKYAYDHGVLIVAAAGNDHNDAKNYPAAYDEVVAVTATDSSDTLAVFSSYGYWVELSAPGVGIYSTVLGNSYVSWSGTSMACPHVSGVAALVWSRFPNYTSAAVRYVLRQSADDLGDFGFDEYYGYGRVNARKAVMGIPPHDLSITDQQFPHRIDPGQQGMFNVTVSNYGGNNETDVSVQFFVNNTLTDSKRIDFLESGYSTTVNFTWGSAILGSYNFTCYVVPVPGENLTQNNVVTSFMQVRFPAVLRVPADYSTIKLALNNASNGDTVLVSDGYYAEGQIDVLEDGVILVADGHAVLDGEGKDYVLNIKADHVVVEGFEIRNGSKYGVNMQGYANTLTKNYIHNNTDGVRFYESTYSIISLNNITTKPSWEWRVYRRSMLVQRSSNNSISQNILKGGALWLSESEGNFLTSNNVSDANFGLVFETSPYNTLRGNNMMNNTRNLAIWKWDVVTLNRPLQYPWQAINDIDASNTVDGKPVYYWTNEHDKTVPLDAGCVILIYCNDITVENLNIKNNLNGILLLDTNGTRISKNNITACSGHLWEYYGGDIMGFFGCSNNIITLNNLTSSDQCILFEWPSNNNVISWNTVANCTLAYGIYINSSNSTVSSNNVMNCGAGICIDGERDTAIRNTIIGVDGYNLLLQGPYHRITENYIRGGDIGIVLDWVSDSVIFANNVTMMNYGIDNWYSSNNLIFHNNFMLNTVSYRPYGMLTENKWDNGYACGGNYWSDYTGYDQNHDGLGDTPHILDESNQDNYPLMHPYIPGDCNHDRIVNIGDAAIIGANWQKRVPPAPANADINNDGIINIVDAAIIGKNWQKHV
jgi:parallel beta-helix repeat protein